MSAPALDHASRPAPEPASGPGRGRHLSPRARRLTLACHVVSSVGWAGLSMAMVVLTVMGGTTTDPAVAKGVYLAMYVFTESAVTVFSSVAAVTGVLLAVGTQWGLLRFWWVVAKWGLTLFVCVVAWGGIRPMLTAAAERTAAPGQAPPDPGPVGAVLLWAVPTMFTLITAAAVISIYKPWGRTPRGRRQLSNRSHQSRRS